MRRSVLALGASIMLIAGACSSGATPAPSSGGGTSAAPSAAAGGGESAAPSGGFDAASISGTAKLSGWQSSDAESAALKDTITAFEAQNSKIKVDYSAARRRLPAVMAANFASGNVPDVFYVDAGYAQQWIDQGFLAPLDDYIAKSGFDTSQFFPGYAGSSRAPTARSTACRRTATRSRWPTTPTSSRPPPKTDGRARHAGPGRSRARTASRRRCASRQASTAGSPSSTPRAARSCPTTARPSRSTPPRPRRRSSGTWTCSRTASA